MKLPLTISLYIIRQFLFGIAIALATFSIVTILIDIIELLRRSHSRDVSFFLILQMVLLKFPQTLNKMMPFAMLVGAVLAYTKLTRTSELVIMRSAGVSVWQFLLPSIISAFAIGMILVLIINPLSTAMLSKYENLEGKYLRGKESFMEISESGLWLRQKNFSTGKQKNTGETVIHARKVIGQEEILLQDVIAFVFAENDKFSKRIDAKEARLMDDYWNLKDVIVTQPDGTTKRHDEYFLETELTTKDLHKSFASPETISFWALPGFIKTLQESGFSAVYHRLYWHSTLASPFFYAAMVLIATLFSLSPVRQGKTGLLISGSIATGFLIYFLSNLVSSMGLSGSMPIVLAAWAPVMTSALIGVGFLLHLEDG